MGGVGWYYNYIFKYLFDLLQNIAHTLISLLPSVCNTSIKLVLTTSTSVRLGYNNRVEGVSAMDGASGHGRQIKTFCLAQQKSTTLYKLRYCTVTITSNLC